MQIFETFGIDWKILIAQIVNFFILMLILKKIFYKPTIKFLEDREEKIRNGLKNADIYQKNLQSLEVEKERVFRQARKDAQKIINQTVAQAEEIKIGIIKNAKSEADKILKKTTFQIENEKRKMIEDVKDDLSNLIIKSLENLTKQKAEKNDSLFITNLLKTELKS